MNTLLDPCPESVWEVLPGGPVAEDEVLRESWQYMGTATGEEPVTHEFRHRSHPLFGHARVYAHVADDDAGPRLALVLVGGRELSLPDDLPEDDR